MRGVFRACRVAVLGWALFGCAAVATDEDAGTDAGPPTGDAAGDAAVECDRTTDVSQLRRDGPAGVTICRLLCTCAEGPALAQVSIGEFCATPSEACNYSCGFVERGAYVEGEYCYLGPPAEE